MEAAAYHNAAAFLTVQEIVLDISTSMTGINFCVDDEPQVLLQIFL